MAMRGKSFYWSIFSVIFAVVGFFVNLIAIGTDASIVNVCILTLIYITPLMIEVIEDVANLDVHNFIQFRLSRISLVIGFLEFIGVMICFVMFSNVPYFEMSKTVDSILRLLFSLMPMAFVARSFYALLLRWKQNENTARAYFPDCKIEFK